MIPDLTEIFKEYEQLRDRTDALFKKIGECYPDCVKCRKGCDDCCHALFDLSFVEAMYLNKAFQENFEHGPLRSRILEDASAIDRNLTKLKRELYQAEKNGADTGEIMEQVAKARVSCPLLNEEGTCAMYENRPITCRLYGIPQEIGGKSHVCGLSGFVGGEKYPAVKLAKIQDRLEELSKKIAVLAKSRFKLNEVYVPLSMALLTNYDESYLGIGDKAEDD